MAEVFGAMYPVLSDFFLSSPSIENYWMCQSRRDNGPLFLVDTWPDLNYEVANVNWDSSVARLITCYQTGHRSPSDWCNSSPCCFIMIELGIDCAGETNKKHLDSISFNKETIRWDFNQGAIEMFLVICFISIRNILNICPRFCVIYFYITIHS